MTLGSLGPAYGVRRENCGVSLAFLRVRGLVNAGPDRTKEAEAEIEMFKEQMVGKKEFPKLDDLAALKGVVKYPSRIKCAILAWSAFHEGLSKGGRSSKELAIPEE